MACLRFGVDSLGKEILELVPAHTAIRSVTPCDTDANGPKHENQREEDTLAACHPYKGENTIVMMEWERPYMRALVDALSITEESNVLEIGFGCGYSADRIQELTPRSHTIIEPDPVVLARLRTWAGRRKGVRIVEGFWQTSLSTIGTFDAIFFDDFPMPDTPDCSDLRGPTSRWHAFIDLCAAHHLTIGGRITGYMARPIQLARPGFEEAPLLSFPVDVPENCPYFHRDEAFIPLITRTAEGTGIGWGSAVPLREGLTSAAQERKKQKRSMLNALVWEGLGL